MSIIHEALKKAGQEKETFVSQTSELDSIRRNLELEYQKKKAFSPWGLFFVILALLFVIGPLLATFFAGPLKQGSSVKTNSKIVPAPQTVPPLELNVQMAQLPKENLITNRKAQFGLEETPLFNPGRSSTAERPALNLSGVVYSPTDSYCIINNKIVKLGGEVDGAKLVNISLREVILEYRGEKVTLAVGD